MIHSLLFIYKLLLTHQSSHIIISYFITSLARFSKLKIWPMNIDTTMTHISLIDLMSVVNSVGGGGIAPEVRPWPCSRNASAHLFYCWFHCHPLTGSSSIELASLVQCNSAQLMHGYSFTGWDLGLPVLSVFEVDQYFINRNRSPWLSYNLICVVSSDELNIKLGWGRNAASPSFPFQHHRSLP